MARKDNKPSKRKSTKPAEVHKKKLTPLQQLYKKEIKRLQRAIKKAEKKGYIFEQTALPTMPKRVTKKSLLQIQKTKPEKLYKKAQKVDYETGELIPAVEARKKEKQQAIEKAKETIRLKKEADKRFWSNDTTESNKQKSNKIPDGGRIIYQNILHDFILKLSEPTPQYTPFGNKRQQFVYETSERERTTLYSLTMRVVAEIGESALGWRIQESADDLFGLLDYVLYGSDAVIIQSASHQIAQVIAGGYLSISDLMDLQEEGETDEDWESPD